MELRKLEEEVCPSGGDGALHVSHRRMAAWRRADAHGGKTSRQRLR